MTYDMLTDLSESRLFPSRQSLDKWDRSKLARTAYLYFLSLQALLSEEDTEKWAVGYCKKAGHAGNFSSWRSDANDLYVLLYRLSDDAGYSVPRAVVQDWLHNPKSVDRMQRLFNRLDAMLHINDSSLKAMRRLIMHWNENAIDERHDIVVKLVAQIKTNAMHSELLAHLQRIKQVTDVAESASVGSTGAASIATAVGDLSSGFDPDGEWRSIYPKKKLIAKPLLVRS